MEPSVSKPDETLYSISNNNEMKFMMSKQSFHPKLLQGSHWNNRWNNLTLHTFGTKDTLLPHSVNVTGPGDYNEHIKFGSKILDSKWTNFPSFSIGKADKLKLLVFDRT